MIKDFDCVQYQRDIRNRFISEAGGDFNQLLKLLNQKAKESELYHFLKDRKEQNAVPTA